MYTPRSKDEVERLLEEKRRLVEDTIRDSEDRIRYDRPSREDFEFAIRNIETTIHDLRSLLDELNFYEVINRPIREECARACDEFLREFQGRISGLYSIADSMKVNDFERDVLSRVNDLRNRADWMNAEDIIRSFDDVFSNLYVPRVDDLDVNVPDLVGDADRILRDIDRLIDDARRHVSEMRRDLDELLMFKERTLATIDEWIRRLEWKKREIEDEMRSMGFY